MITVKNNNLYKADWNFSLDVLRRGKSQHKKALSATKIKIQKYTKDGYLKIALSKFTIEVIC